jgi:hypothetical protein
MGTPPPRHGDQPASKGARHAAVSRWAQGAFAEKQKRDLAARLTDVIVRYVIRAERS